MADGSIRIDLDLEIREAEKKLEELKQKTVEMSGEINKTDNKNIEQLAESYQKTIDKTKQALSNAEIYQQKILELQYDLGNWQEWGDSEQVEATERRIAGYQQLLDKTKQTTEELSQQGVQADSYIDKLDTINAKKETSVVKTKAVTRELDKATSSGNRLSGTPLKFNKAIGKSVMSIKKMTFALLGARTAYSLLSKITREWLNSTDAGAQQVKAGIGQITTALTNILAPVLTWLANIVLTLLGYLNAVLGAFFGINLFAKKTADNAGDIGGGIKKANKELKKFTAGFDKAEVMSEQVADNMGGAGGGELATPDFISPDVSGFTKAVEDMKTALTKLWNTDTVQGFFDDVKTIASNYFNAYKSIGANVWDNLVTTWKLLLPNLKTGFNNLLTLYSTMLSDIADFTTKWFPLFTSKLNSFVTSVFTTFRPLHVFFTQLWADITGIMLDTWNTYGVPILDEFGLFIDNTMAIFNRIWTDIIDPIITPAIQMLETLWNEHLRDVIVEFSNFIAELVLGVLRIYNEAIAPLVNMFVDFLAPKIKWLAEKIFPLIGSSLGLAVDYVKILINTMRGVFQGFLTFISGVFTGDWKKAWQDVVKIFETVFGGLKEMAKAPLNYIIDMINKVIGGLNSLKIPKWVPFIGGNSMNFATIPRLAKGGVLTRPTLNIAGEYAGARSNPEIVTPESLMRKIVNEELGKVDMGGNAQPQIIQLVVDGKKLAEIVNDSNKSSTISRNGALAWNM